MAERLKARFFTEESVGALADTLKKHHRKFDEREFLRAVFDSAFGDQLEFSFALKLDTKRACKVRLEYVVTFAKVGGKTGTKVFQITENAFQPGEYPIARKHSFADMSTRKHHPGKHELAIVVNGVQKARAGLRLRAKRATTLT